MTQSAFYHVDAFTALPFVGNPAVVCLLEEDRPASWMQQVAWEMNLSETVFVRQDGTDFHLRWFTPRTEVELCGHATLAAAHVLWETRKVPSSELIRFHTRGGLLYARRDVTWIELDFPATPPSPSTVPEGLERALGAKIGFARKTRFDYLLELESEVTVRRLTPHFQALAKLPVRGIIVTSRSDDPKYDFVSRFFAPAAGVNEDPVTGSSHCALGPYWKGKLQKDEFTAYQASERGGVVHVKLRADRVLLSGQAITIASGQLANL